MSEEFKMKTKRNENDVYREISESVGKVLAQQGITTPVYLSGFIVRELIKLKTIRIGITLLGREVSEERRWKKREEFLKYAAATRCRIESDGIGGGTLPSENPGVEVFQGVEGS